MLFLPPGTSMPVRVHGAFVSDEEVHAVAGDWKARGAPDYIPDLLAGAPDPNVPGVLDIGTGGDTESDEPLYDEAVAFVLESRRASISAVQRKLRIGYNRAARLIEAMEQAGVVSADERPGRAGSARAGCFCRVAVRALQDGAGRRCAAGRGRGQRTGGCCAGGLSAGERA